MPFLAEVVNNPDFFEHLFYAVALHDFGKAAEGFQEQLTDRKRWNYRHEILSGGFAVYQTHMKPPRILYALQKY